MPVFDVAERCRGTAFGKSRDKARGAAMGEAYVHEVVIACGAEVIARHPRSYEREDFVFNPLHYGKAGFVVFAIHAKEPCPSVSVVAMVHRSWVGLQ